MAALKQLKGLNVRHPPWATLILSLRPSELAGGFVALGTLPSHPFKPPSLMCRLSQDDLEVVEEEAAAARKKLDKGFIKRVEPFYTRRRGIVTGKEEPSEDLLEGYEDPAGASGSFKDVKGIPYFWLTVLRHQDTIAEFITKRDEGALEYLEDVCVANPPGGEGIRVDFHFSPNPYFSNKVLSKQIAITQAASPLLEMSPGNISEECPPIEWKAGMSLLLRESKKKEKKGKGGKGGKGGEEPGAEGAVKLKRCASFFSFFTNTLKVAEDSDDEGGAFAIDPAALPSEGRGGRERRSARDEKLAAAHLEILTALWKDVVPNAVTLYTSGAFAIERQKDEAAAEEDDYEVVSAAEASLENLPKKVRQRLHALQALQTQVVSLRRDLRKEAHAGEEFFEEKAAKLHAARREVLRPPAPHELYTEQALDTTAHHWTGTGHHWTPLDRHWTPLNRHWTPLDTTGQALDTTGQALGTITSGY
eukprot:CAMPEP_0182908052 /NCGR_PEP_ID=MMETSP0034_2-20130328/34948_1 /TAXON_ID=156128 /ORGANISM="Nephroselmis pyriformis, Strain CCMP717" /LENGTH=475 /DNA_ID=CAMNT_0025044157 /DNA_START=353 /DNA_END=1780 /DNA_ORIENTATION=+